MRDSRPLLPTPIFTAEQLASDLSQRLDVLSHRYGPIALRVSIGIVFLWFGVLKFFANLSPAEEIAVQTLTKLTLGLVPARALLLGLALFETAIGACFLAGLYRRVALPLLFCHMLGTGLPFLLFPEQLFNQSL